MAHPEGTEIGLLRKMEIVVEGQVNQHPTNVWWEGPLCKANDIPNPTSVLAVTTQKPHS